MIYVKGTQNIAPGAISRFPLDVEPRTTNTLLQTMDLF